MALIAVPLSCNDLFWFVMKVGSVMNFFECFLHIEYIEIANLSEIITKI
jgi:hypothetical protein